MTEKTLSEGLAILASRTTVVRLALYAYIGLSTLAILMWATTLAFDVDQVNDPSNPLVATAGIASIAILLVYIGCIVTISMWIHRAHANLFAAGMNDLEFTPGWSVGWFFVPLALLFKPFQAMRELWNRSHLADDGFTAPADYRLTAWWTCWLIGNFIDNVLWRAQGFAGTIGVIDLIAYALHVAAAWFLLDIVNHVASAQTSDLDASHAFA
ncbi:DUF4328 domain-containing protein [Novosphingobium clariflavum]|uniref:DUF4328 domain-containing protein n=1 Tax=Novosphingobium clariflavum TaxID=2029884 RepID=A0ABV6S3P0_9SPHN|nr:DUF4328 domain-containing protein [Novosphingobium clariflavum]